MKHFDLFSGYGGFSLALQKVYEDKKLCAENEGQSEMSSFGNTEGQSSQQLNKSNERQFNTIGFSEIDKYASAVLRYHWPNTKNYGDIKKINWDNVPDFDLLTGGSPCQDLSIAGKRGGLKGERSGLFYEYMRAVREKKPKYFIWENVKGALSSNKGFDFLAVINEMAEAGYSLWWQVLNAKDFGVPQNRERIFVIGFRDGSPREVFFEREGNKEITELQGQQGITNTLTTRYTATGSGAYISERKLNAQIKQLNNPTHSNNRLYSEEGISPALNTAQGGNRQPKILSSLQAHSSITEGISPTLPSAMGLGGGHTPMVLGESKIRRLTPTECERLMGLPDDWLKYGIDEKGNQIEISDTQRYKMAGNGVVVNVVEEIIKKLIK